MAPRLSGQISIFGVVFFVSKSLLGIEGQKKLEKFAIFTRKPRSHARILIYRTWPIDNIIMCMRQLCILGQGKLVMVLVHLIFSNSLIIHQVINQLHARI